MSDSYPPHLARLLHRLPPEVNTLVLFFPTEPTCRETGLLRQPRVGYRHLISEATVCLIIDSRKASRFPRTLSSEKKILMTLLSSAMGGYRYSSDSTLPDPSPHIHLFSYGPSLQNRPTTISYEMEKICDILEISCVLRVELVRSLSLRFHERLPQEDVSQIFQELITGTSLVEHNTPMLQHRPAYTKLLTFSQSRPQLDIVTQHIMYAMPHVPQSLSIQASTSDSYNLHRYFVITSESKSVTFAEALNSSLQTLNNSFCHLHASTGSPVRILNDVNFTKTLMFSGQILAAVTGILLPSLHHGVFSQGVYFYDHLFRWSSCIGRTGVPLPLGFTRFNNSDQDQNNPPILHRSLLNLCPKENLLTIRKRPGQLVICLGDFLPTTGPDHPPFLYEDSASDLNNIWSVIQTFLRSSNKPVISGSGMAHGAASMRGQLKALLGNAGAILCLSCLPKHVKEFIMSAANAGEDIPTLIETCYLNLYTNQVLLILDNTLLPPDQGANSSVGLLLHFAKIHSCQVTVLGVTTDSHDLIVINDMEDPIDPLTHAIHTSDLPRFSFDLDIPNPILPESLPRQALPDLPIWDESFQTIHGTLIQILGHPSVSNKDYIVRHLNRCGQGLVAQQQGVGPLDIPLSDYSVICHHCIYPERLDGAEGEPMTQDMATYLMTRIEEWFTVQPIIAPHGFPASVLAVGEQPIKMKIDPLKGAVYGLTELVTNMMFSNTQNLEDIMVSASITWTPSEEMLNLLTRTMFYCKEWCRELGLQLSFTGSSSSQTQAGPEVKLGGNYIVFTGHANVFGTDLCVLPDLKKERGILIYLPVIRTHVKSGTIFSQFWKNETVTFPDIPTDAVRNLFLLAKKLQAKKYVLSAHDVSDGGVLACACEMAIAGCRGLNLTVPNKRELCDYLESETPGTIIEIDPRYVSEVEHLCNRYGIQPIKLGVTGGYGIGELITVRIGADIVMEESVSTLLAHWSNTSADFFRGTIKDDSFDATLHRTSYGQNEIDLQYLTDHLRWSRLRLFTNPTSPKSVAVLHWPGCPDQIHMMSAFTNVGFSVHKVMISELVNGNLDAFAGLAIAGECSHICPIAEAKAIVQSIMKRPRICRTLWDFLARNNSFSLCCGEVGFLLLTTLGVVGTESINIPTNTEEVKIDLEENSSGAFESLWLNFKIEDSRSVLLFPLRNMIFPGWIQGTHLGLRYMADGIEHSLVTGRQVAMTFHGPSTLPDNHATHYPRNPTSNSPVAGLTSSNGRHLALLMNPALSFHNWQWQYIPPEVQPLVTTPWAILFQRLFIFSMRT